MINVLMVICVGILFFIFGFVTCAVLTEYTLREESAKAYEEGYSKGYINAIKIFQEERRREPIND